MKIGNNEVELFEIIAKQSDDTIDKYNLFAGELENKRAHYEQSFIILSSLKLITIKNAGRPTITKLQDFHEAVFQGGLNEFIDYKQKKEKLENDIISSNLKTNKYSRISMVSTLIIGSLTLIALIIQIVLQCCSQ